MHCSSCGLGHTWPANTMWRKLLYSEFETCFGPSTQGAETKTHLKSRFSAILKKRGAMLKFGIGWPFTGHTFRNIEYILENEFDWPMLSSMTAYYNSTDAFPDINGPVDSVYMKMKARNLCTHRDFQNLGVNGARAGAMNSTIQVSVCVFVRACVCVCACARAHICSASV